MNLDGYMLRCGADKGTFIRIVQGQEVVPGRVNVGNLPIGIELPNGERRSVPRDWITLANGKLGRQLRAKLKREAGR